MNNNLYWKAQTLGWLGVNLCLVFLLLDPFSTVGIMPYLTVVIINTLVGISLSHLLKLVYTQQATEIKVVRRNVLALVGVCLLGAALIGLFMHMTSALLSNNSLSLYIKPYLIGLVEICIWLGLAVTTESVRSFHRDLQTETAVQNLMRNTELDTLKSQLNPHFLFNSLNSIKALVRIDPPQAQKSIIQLSDILRKSLTISETPMVDLLEELSMMQQYLDLEKIRFDKRLNYHFKIENQSLGYRIPSMSLYLLVENAIKHGISRIVKGGELFIHTRIEEKNLIIIVRNTGTLVVKEHFYGVSLNNLERRLHNIYADRASLHFREDNNFVIATLTIPLS